MPTMFFARSAAVAMAALVSAPAALAAAESTSADWPCVQRKVPTLSAEQMWDGPSVDGVKFDAPEVRKLVATLASRRIPHDEAVAALKEFAGKQPPGEKDAKLTAVFAGLISTVNAQRSGVLAGIERFQQRQRQRSAEIEREGERITKLKLHAPRRREGPPGGEAGAGAVRLERARVPGAAIQHADRLRDPGADGAARVRHGSRDPRPYDVVMTSGGARFCSAQSRAPAVPAAGTFSRSAISAFISVISRSWASMI